MLQKGHSVLLIATLKGFAETVLLLLRHHAAVDLHTESDVRHSNTIYTIDIDACTCTCNSHCYIVIDSEKPLWSQISNSMVENYYYPLMWQRIIIYIVIIYTRFSMFDVTIMG